MAFPLADWIDGHADCHHNLGRSGMVGAIPAPIPSAAEVRRADDGELRARLASDLKVEPARLFLTTGASQANALTILFLARGQRGGAAPRCRVCLPEYPPLFDTARLGGFRLTDRPGSAELALISQPRNPEGDLWDRTRLLEWASGARWLLVDETFREFAGARSLVTVDRPGLWVTGSFTKFYAADDLRVGFVVAPAECVPLFERFYGLVRNLLPKYSVAGALRAFRDREATRRRVGAILSKNVAAMRKVLPEVRGPVAPVVFDRPTSGEDGDSLQQRAANASVLVCSGSFFGDPSGVRLCLTQRSFPADLAAYLSVRNAPNRPSRKLGAPRRVTGPGQSARRRPGGTGRGTTSPSSRD